MDRFTDWDDGSVKPQPPPQCPSCRNLIDRERWRCRAYPLGIPAAILVGRWDHRRPFPGDNGIRFEPAEKPEPERGVLD